MSQTAIATPDMPGAPALRRRLARSMRLFLALRVQREFEWWQEALAAELQARRTEMALELLDLVDGGEVMLLRVPK